MAARTTLLPTSSLGAQAYSDPLLECPPAPSEADWDRPFAGLHCAALTEPGPSGTRGEHITDLLNVPRRVHANKIHAALFALFCRILGRLCWQRKIKPRPIKMGELLRSAYANQQQVVLRSKTLRMHQWGIRPNGRLRRAMSVAWHHRAHGGGWLPGTAGGDRPGPQ